MVDGVCKCEMTKKFDQEANCVDLGENDKLKIIDTSFNKST